MVESEIGLSITERSIAAPNIIYNDDLFREDVPYNIKVNAESFGEFLSDQGLSSEKIAQTTIQVKRASKVPSMLSGAGVASFNLLDGKVTIFGDKVWRTYEKLLKSARNLTERKGRFTEKRASNSLRKHLYTQKLPRYLQQAPSDRALDFANRIFLDTTSREASTSLLQKTPMIAGRRGASGLLLAAPRIAVGELSGLLTVVFYGHLPVPMTGEQEVDNLIRLTVSMGIFRGVLGIETRLNPIKRKGREIKDKYNNEPLCRQIVTIEPK